MIQRNRKVSHVLKLEEVRQLKLYYLNLFDMPEVKDPKGREWKRKFLPE